MAWHERRPGPSPAGGARGLAVVLLALVLGHPASAVAFFWPGRPPEPSTTPLHIEPIGLAAWLERPSLPAVAGSTHIPTERRPASRESREGPALSVFRTDAVAVARLPVSDRWELIQASRPEWLFSRGCLFGEAICRSALVAAWHRLSAAHAGGPIDQAVVASVNLAVNLAVRYAPDMTTWGIADYWASPIQTALMGAGDCEDIAIAKLWVLAALGVPRDAMQIVVVSNTRRRVLHAVLRVNLEPGASLILDNLNNVALPEYAVTWYRPLYALAIHGTWAFEAPSSGRATEPIAAAGAAISSH